MKEVKTMSLKNYVSNFVSMFDDGFSPFNTKEEDVSFLIKTNGEEMKSKFKKFSESFCENRNRVNDGLYEFISFDGTSFTFSVTK